MSLGQQINLNVIANGSFGNLLGEVNKFKSELKSLKLPNDVTKRLEGSFDKLNTEATKFQSILAKGINTKGDFSKLMSSANGVQKAMTTIKQQVDSISDKQLKLSIQNLPEVKQLETELNKVLSLQKQLKNYGTTKATGAMGAAEVAQIDQLISKMQEAKSIRNSFNAIGKAFETGNIEKMNVAIGRLIAQVEQYKIKMNGVQGAASSSNTILNWANSLKQGLNTTVAEADRLKNSINQLQTGKFNEMRGSINGISSGLNTATNNMKNFVNAQTQAASRTNQLNEQVGLLRTQANYFFGLQNMGRLIARGIREAAESVRDLDKAMTETAVVTDFSVSDMWNMLPEYTKLANKLGATTQGAYETMTLYFQQGLDKQQTFEIGEETMKMARIAGLDYAQTTNMMTAALRGFNMELNQTSAQRVNDVYSKLAAITASDTRELGLAMERTASIAHSANMDFGNTTAFLAQMIETTREAPENLGTAMKTIIARFQELKQNPYEISEVEGEEVDFNRIDKALKTIGVDLMDSRDKFRDLDDVFMDISSKWDGLSQTTQRYIATIAAGSRQQSRFLAMVQNYDRLKELTDAAANSEGAATVQFNKTLDSYEAKVNKLKNAWQAFTMSLANNGAVKGGVDLLQKIITLGNKIIEVFGKAGKAIGGNFGKGLAEMAAAFGLGALGFRGLKTGANLGLGMLGRMTVKNAVGDSGIFPAGEMAGKKMAELTKDEKSAVLQKRKELYQLMNKGGNNKLTPFNVKDLQDNLKNLTAEQQKALYSSSPGLNRALEKSYSNAYKKLDLTRESNAAIKKHLKVVGSQIKSGERTLSNAVKNVMNPYQLSKEIGGPTGREIVKQIDEAIIKNPNNDAIQKRWEKLYDQKVKNGKIDPTKTNKGAWVQEQRRDYTAQKMIDQKTPLTIGAATNAMSRFSAATMKGGQAMMGLGMAISTAGFPALGSIVSTIGTGIMGVGMAAEGAAGMVGKLGTALKFLGKNPAILALTAVTTAMAAAVAIGVALDKKSIKNIRKSGDEVVKTYTETSDKIKKELDNLTEYQENWGTWSEGVDENGYNVSLGTAEYEEYLKAVKEITTAHPELIKGYNALGNAIIDNNTALREATRLAKEEEKQAKKDYLDSGQKIVDKQKTYKRWKKTQEKTGDTTTVDSKGEVRTYVADTRSQYEKEAQDIVNAVKEIEGGEEVLKRFNIELDESGNLTANGIESLRTRAGDLNNALKEDVINPTEKQQEALDKVNDSIAQFGDTVQGVEDATKDYYDWAWTYVTEQGYNEIDSNLIAPFQTSIERIAEKGLGANKTKQLIDDLAKTYQTLGGHAQDFADIQEKVNDAQKDFGKDLDVNAYKQKVEEATAPLDDWIESLRNNGDEASRVLADYLENAKAKMLDITKSALTLGEAFNVMSGNIAAARAAYGNWEKRSEGGDYYTAADDFKKMLEEVNDDIDNLGKGSQQWWSAAQTMFGDDYVFSHSKETIQKHMDAVSKYFKEGKEGAQNFMAYLDSSETQNLKLDPELFKPKKGEEPLTIGDFIRSDENGLDFSRMANISDEQFESIANTLGLSNEAFTALLDKARQFYNIKFGNVEEMRTAIAASESTIAGKSFTGENRNMYMRESEFRREGIDAGVSPDDIKKYQKTLTKSGVTFLKGANEIKKADLGKYIKDWGIATEKNNTTTANAFIKYFDKLGYSQDEISKIYKKAGDLIKDRDEIDFNEEYKNARESNADPAVAAATSIDNNVGSILGVVESIAVAMGVLTQSDKEKIGQETDKLQKDINNLRNGEGTSYKENKETIESDIAALEEAKASLIVGQSNFEEGSDKWKEYDVQINKIQGYIDRANGVLESVTENDFDEAQKLNEFANFFSTDGGKAAYEKFTTSGFGNAPLQERQAESFGINWGKKPSKNDNFENAKTWGLTADDLRGTTSKYLSRTMGFGEGENEVQIAFTPILNKDGKAQMLAQKDVEEYLDNIVTEATDKETGKINVDKLMELDKEGAEINGQKFHDLVMGSFEGEGAIEASNAFGQLEHLFSERIPAGLTDFSALTDAATAADELGTNLTEAGGAGVEAAHALRQGFIDANADGLSKLDGTQLSKLLTKLGATQEDLDYIAQMHPEIDISAVDDSLVNDVDAQRAEIEKNPIEVGIETVASGAGNMGKAGVESVASGIVQNLPKLKVETEDNELDETKEKAKETKTILDTGATFTVGVTGGTALAQVASSAAKLTKAKSTKTIGVKTGKVDTSTVKDASSAISKMNPNIDVGAIDHATSKAEAWRALIDKKSASIDVTASTSGTWSKDFTVNVKINKTNVGGKTISTGGDDNNSHTGGFISTSGVQYKAKGGQIFQKKYTDTVPAMLTPGEYVHRTAAVKYFGIDFMRKINHKDLQGALQTLGSSAKGPKGRLGPKGKGGLTLTGEKGFEIAWLPSESRSMILGANGPQMVDLPNDTVVWTHEQSKKILNRKSIAAGSHYGPDGDAKRDWDKGGSGGGNGNGNRGGGGNGQDQQNADDAAKVIKKAGKISVWWENQARKIEATQRKVDKALKKVEEKFKQIGKTIGDARKYIKRYRKNLNHSIALNKLSKKRATKELRNLAKSGKKSKRQISYEVTTEKNGKKKTKTVKKKVSLSKYIKWDNKNDTYIIDQKALNKIAKKNKSKAKAIKEAAEKEINDKLSKRNTAIDNIEKAREALKKLNNDIYETFYRWEKSINKVYLLTQKLETLSKRLDVKNSRLDWIFSKIGAGYTTENQRGIIKSTLRTSREVMVSQAEANSQLVNSTWKEFEKSLNLNTYGAALRANPNSTEAKGDYEAAKKALEFLDNVGLSGENFDYQKALNKLNSAGYNEETYNAIKGVLDKIFEKQGAYLDALSETYQSLEEIYAKINEYQEFIAEFEGDLLKGLEEQTEAEINKLEKLDSALSKAFQNLLDEIKRKLDERRKEEDNAKTETELSQKYQRLAMLRADTAGGHQVEIAQLEKEIADAQKDYQRNLEDQLLDKLQQQGDEASKQRQRQIDLLQAQLDFATATGTNLKQVNEWLKNPTANKEEIRAAWYANAGYEEATAGERAKIERDFDVAWEKYLAYSKEIKEWDKTIKAIKKVEDAVNKAYNNNSTSTNNPIRGKEGVRDAVAKAKKNGKNLGKLAKSLRESGSYSDSDILGAGAFTAGQLRKAGFTAKQIRKYGVNTNGKAFTAKDLAAAGFTAKQMRQAGYSAEFLSNLRDKNGKRYYSDKDIIKAGYSGRTLEKTKGYKGRHLTASRAKKLGVSGSRIAKIYGTKDALKVGVSGRTIQRATGNSAGYISRTAYQNRHDKDVSRSDLGGLKSTLDINGKKKGGKLSGHISSTGRRLVAAKGSTLYWKEWDWEHGKVKGKLHKVPIESVSKDFAKANKAEVKQALTYAIKHRAPGSKINSNIKSLVSILGMSGKTFKLNNGYKGSLSTGGNIHYNSNKDDGVHIWHLDDGKTALRKYKKDNLAQWKKWAALKDVGREYRSILKKHKIKYATGGLADYTGPAWLDGTPSKPELVLNSVDTKNFIALKDVLSNVMSSAKSGGIGGGNTEIQVNINVDHINNDYDVDKIAKRVKENIVKDAGYRNVTQVRNFR